MAKLALEKGALRYFPDVWVRIDGKEVADKNTELFEQISMVTEMNFTSSDWEVFREITGDPGEHYQCACSKLELTRPFIVNHVPTDTKVLIGSSCINKFGNEDLDADVRAHKRGNKCIGGNIIPDLRTRDGRDGLCPNYNCRCKLPLCKHCFRIVDTCKCSECLGCSKKFWKCSCPKCTKCKTILKSDGSCNCEICDWCEQYPSKCTCETCDVCLKYTQVCKCKKCKKCRVSLPMSDSWKPLCKPCWRADELVDCDSCDRKIPKHPFKKLCRECYLETR